MPTLFTEDGKKTTLEKYDDISLIRRYHEHKQIYFLFIERRGHNLYFEKPGKQRKNEGLPLDYNLNMEEIGEIVKTFWQIEIEIVGRNGDETVTFSVRSLK